MGLCVECDLGCPRTLVLSSHGPSRQGKCKKWRQVAAHHGGGMGQRLGLQPHEWGVWSWGRRASYTSHSTLTTGQTHTRPSQQGEHSTRGSHQQLRDTMAQWGREARPLAPVPGAQGGAARLARGTMQPRSLQGSGLTVRPRWLQCPVSVAGPQKRPQHRQTWNMTPYMLLEKKNRRRP